MVNLGPITHLEIGGQNVTAHIRTQPDAAQPTCNATLDHAGFGLIRCDQEHVGTTYHCGPITGTESTLTGRYSWHDHTDGATPHQTPPVTEANEATVCHAYVPPTDKPDDSGYCARCGMFDWRHREPVPEDIAAWLKDPANHQAVAAVLRTEVRRDPRWWEQELRRLARVHGSLGRFAYGG